MTRRRLTFLVVLLAGLGILPSTAVQARAGEATQVQRLTFCLSESVSGQLLPPRCELLEVRESPRWRSLIGYRPDFTAEMYRTAERM